MAEGDGIGPMARQPIRGGSLSEADLPVAAWPAVRERSQSPMAQGLRRLRRNRTALVGAAIVVLLVVVAIFADVLAPHSPTTPNQPRPSHPPSRRIPPATNQPAPPRLTRSSTA